jgi:hypothetical protein
MISATLKDDVLLPTEDVTDTPEIAEWLVQLFRGREDTIAVRKNGSDPFPERDRQPITAGEVQRRHLTNKERLGFYLMRIGNTVHCACLDIDNHADNEGKETNPQWREQVVLVAYCLLNLSIPFLVEISSSGRGAHIWIFFSEPVPAKLPRTFWSTVCSSLNLTPAPEIFPKQDELDPPKNGKPSLGNLVWYPCSGNSHFVNVDDWSRIPSIEALSDAKRLGPQELTAAIESLRPSESTRAADQRDSGTIAGDCELTPEQLCDMADHISAEHSVHHDSWIEVGQSIHDSFPGEDGFRAFVLFSSKCSEKFNESVCRKRWDSFTRGGKRTIGTAIRLAKLGGWQRPRSVRTSSNGAAPTHGARSDRAAAPAHVTNGQTSKEGFIPAPMAEITSKIQSATGDWPRRVDSDLFVHDESTNAINWLDSHPALFGYIGAKTGEPATFHNATGAHTKSEVFAELRRTVKSYESVETLPHEPRLETAYYACRFPPAGNGNALRTLVKRFCPATTIDGDLILAFFVTLFWGGRGGARPVFAWTSDFGRGTGKSTAVNVGGRLAGGVLELSMNENAEVIKQRLLSPNGKTKRIACLDNAKASRFSWGDLEALVTSPTISGKALYVGESTRPNNLVWTLTLNGVSLATDMAQRCVIIKLDKPKHSATWAEETFKFVDEHQQEIVGDILGLLRRPRTLLADNSRWGAWEHDVLSRLPEPADAQRAILDRQLASDTEREEVDIVEEYIESQLSDLQFSPSSQRIFIPSVIAREWLCQATNERYTTAGASRWLNQQITEDKFQKLDVSRGRKYGRGFMWIGEDAGDSAIVADLESRVSALMGSAKHGGFR